MPSPVQDALIELMIVAASSDTTMTERELARIESLVGRLPVFEDFDMHRIAEVANACADKINGNGGFEEVVEAAIAAVPQKLQDTAYSLAVEVIASDLHTSQEELRFLEFMRDHLRLDRLTTAAIETAARARHRRLPDTLTQG
ncbi:hypothetical protein VE25_06005 [Devosia geojensis]|uniref:Co-chaperone DjlA N-terminal domain-containing protein n=1 Tax=Devosia geojensis TaxID=443610 RepID=A0A0F5FV30_9HYPH|nr:tellurite resistance TerB family protein [Devosia geojensis]KKB12683.1 hypothetical protein VE25_06005 [Devosia geojensis]